MGIKSSKKHELYYSSLNVKSIVHEGVRYSSPIDEIGFIIATDIRTNETIWTKQIYKSLFGNSLGQDYNLSFINEINLNKDKLKICNENNEVFYLDINSRVVSKRVDN